LVLPSRHRHHDCDTIELRKGIIDDPRATAINACIMESIGATAGLKLDGTPPDFPPTAL
jgi:hypothetical protein